MKKTNTTNNEDNDGEIKLELIKVIATMLKLIEGKRNIWRTMELISKINSTYMSWISLHEETPGTNLKIPLIRRNCKFVLASS